MKRLALALVIASLLGCGAGSDDAADGGEGSARLEVVAAFLPLEEAAVRVGGDGVTVRNLTPPGAEPHDIELSPRDVDRIIDADVVLHLGADFQPAIADAAENADGEVVDVLTAVTRQSGGDAHIWLDPSLMIAIVEEVRDAFAQVDPAGEQEYQRNAEAFIGELGQVDEDMSAGLDACARRTIVTAHDAFGYLAQRYELTQRGIAGLSPDAEPDPARLASLADEVRKDGTTTIFYETLVAPDIAETLARETGVDVAVLNPIEGLTADQAELGATYESLMRENLAALQAALGCT